MSVRRAASRRLSLAIAIALSAAATTHAQAQTSTVPITRLLELEGIDVSFVALSPDGRWLAYSRSASEKESHLFVRSIEGRQEAQITPPGRAMNARPRFSPAGDRIVFESSIPARPGEQGLYLMAVPFDTRTGRATGAPRQVSLEPIRNGGLGAAVIAPDGQSIAYTTCCDAKRLRVVPATGGNARTVLDGFDPRTQLVNVAWTDDGRALVYALADAGGSSWRVMRVSADGGAPVEVRRSSTPIGLLAPGARFSALVLPYGPNRQQRELRVHDQTGALIKRVRLPDNFDPRTLVWSRDGRRLIGNVRGALAVVRIAPTNGGPTRALSSGQGYDWPEGWSADSRTVYLETSVGDRPVMDAVTIEGTRRSRVELPSGGDYGSWVAIAGRYAIGTTGWIDSVRERATARNLEDGTRIEVTRARYRPAAQLFIRGAGGTYSVDGDAYLYYERVGSEMQLRSIVPGQAARVLHTFPAASAGQLVVAVHRGRVIYGEMGRDSVRYMLVTNGGSPRPIATIAADAGTREIAWTRDGRHVAFGGAGSTIHVLELGPDATPVSALKAYQMPFEYMYELSFLDDGRHLTMIAQPRGGPNAVVASVSLDDPSRPLILSESDGTSAWGHLLSPDGRWTAYAAELSTKGTTVYSIDLSELRATAASSKR